MRSMSFKVRPVAFRTFWIAGTGPKPIIEGSTPTVEYPTTLANGFKLFFAAASSLANTSAPAPSQIP